MLISSVVFTLLTVDTAIVTDVPVARNHEVNVAGVEIADPVIAVTLMLEPDIVGELVRAVLFNTP